MTAQERIERAEKELAEAKKMLENENLTVAFEDLEIGEFFCFDETDDIYIRVKTGERTCSCVCKSHIPDADTVYPRVSMNERSRVRRATVIGFTSVAL